MANRRWLQACAASPVVLAGVAWLQCACAADPAALPAPAAAAERHPLPVTYERGPTDQPRVALTFDGGGDAGDTEHIIAVLEEKGVRATFFLTGAYITGFPGLARAIAAAGHEVGNHTWSHPHLTSWEADRRQDTLPGVDRDFLLRELAETGRAWEETTGLPMAPLWRAPYGEVNAALGSWADDAGWLHVGWTRDDRGTKTLDSLDWVDDRGARRYLDSAGIVARLLAFDELPGGLSGGIVLMHLSSRRVDPAASRLGELIDALRSRGYRLVTVHELLAAEPVRERPPRDAVALSSAR